MPICLLSTHHALFPFPGETSPAVQVRFVLLQLDASMVAGWAGTVMSYKLTKRVKI